MDPLSPCCQYYMWNRQFSIQVFSNSLLFCKYPLKDSVPPHFSAAVRGNVAEIHFYLDVDCHEPLKWSEWRVSGWLPEVKRSHTSELPMYPHGQQDMKMMLLVAAEPQLTKSVLFVSWGRSWGKEALEHFNHCFAPVSVIDSDCISWSTVTPATIRHSWREQVEDGSMWQKISRDLL